MPPPAAYEPSALVGKLFLAAIDEATAPLLRVIAGLESRIEELERKDPLEGLQAWIDKNLMPAITDEIDERIGNALEEEFNNLSVDLVRR